MVRVTALRRVLGGLKPQRASGLLVLAGIIVLFSLLEPETFPTVFTVRTVGQEQAVTAILALALTVPLAASAFDLSIGGTLGVTSILCAYLLSNHYPAPIACVLTLCAGVVIGLFNGTLVGILRMDSFIATLGTSAILGGLVTLISGNQYIVGIPPSFSEVAGASFAGVPILFLYLVVAVLLAWYVLEYTLVGRHLYAVGGNYEAARLSGVRARTLTFASLMVSAVGASIGGILVTSQIGAGSPTVGPSYLLPTFAAVFLGATQFKVGRVNAFGTVLAVYLLAVGVRGLQLAGAPLYVSDVFNGLALIVAVGISMFSKNPAGSLARRLLVRQLRWLPKRTRDPYQAEGQPNEPAGPENVVSTSSTEGEGNSTKGSFVGRK